LSPETKAYIGDGHPCLSTFSSWTNADIQLSSVFCSYSCSTPYSLSLALDAKAPYMVPAIVPFDADKVSFLLHA
jgi:hypothetical protein